MAKVVFVTSGQPSANPRLAKEVAALSSFNCEITVIYAPISLWADKYDRQLMNSYPQIKWMQAGYHQQKQKYLYFFARIRQKTFQYIYKAFGNVQDAAIKSLVLFHQELWKKTSNIKADLYIGHNLGALPVVVKASKKYNAKAVFDFEDFHRGEDDRHSLHWKKVTETENKYVHGLQFATAASPLIAEMYKSFFPDTSFFVINNCFPASYILQQQPILAVQPIKLFWFSQTIGTNRGLENIIAAMGNLPQNALQLILLGNISTDTKAKFINLATGCGLNEKQLVFLPATSEKEIVNIAAHCHIGLACEVPHILNRELCLTNKIFTYLLAGNAILFSDTKAQAGFLKENEGVGSLFQHDSPTQLSHVLKEYIANPTMLHQKRQQALLLAATKMNWEMESKKWIDIIKGSIVLN